MIFLLHTSPESVSHAASFLCHQNLYEKTGNLRYVWPELASVGTYRKQKVMLIVAYENQRDTDAIGVLVFYVNKAEAKFYVKPAHRRKGVATKMLRALRTAGGQGDRVITGEVGWEGSQQFFAKNFVYVPDTGFGPDDMKAAAERMCISYVEGDYTSVTFGRLFKEVRRYRKRQFLESYKRAKREGKI